jgi:hypothetical protein
MPIELTRTALVALLAFAGVSIVIGVRLASAGGWRETAERFPAPAAPPAGEQRFRFASLRVAGGGLRQADYENCVTIGVSEAGISLSLLRLFRLFHPPMLIPWSAVDRCTAETVLWGHRTRVTLRDGVVLVTGGPVAEALLARWIGRSHRA